jgi:hypothetical protein
MLRVWYVSTNTVFTIVGQESRVLQTADGSVLDPSVGLNAIWGVTVLSSYWIAWSEADTNLIRTVSSKPLCKVGEHYDGDDNDSAGSQCVPCDPASKPNGTTFINNIDCAWACPDPPHQYLPFVCPEFQSPPVLNAKLAVEEGEGIGIMVVCNAGYEKTSEFACELCPAGYYCDGTNTGKKPCQNNSYSLPGATSQREGCICNPSFYHDNGTCLPCPINHYCPGSKQGGGEAIQCPSGTTSNTTTSISIDNCTCHNGSLAGYDCTVCKYLPPLAKYVSSNMQEKEEDCKWVCPKGYHRVGDYFKNGYCAPCTFQGPCDNMGEYVSYDDGTYCGILQDGQSDHICLPCSRRSRNVVFTSNNNNCSMWECQRGYFFDAFWDRCVPCDTRKYTCPQGQHRAKCTTHSDSVCVPCPGVDSVVGGFLTADTCDLVCYDGWKRLPNGDKKKCCSDNSLNVGVMNNGTAQDCICSAGFTAVEEGSICQL